MNEKLGQWLESQRFNGVKWLWAFFVFLALLLITNMFVMPHNAHFPGETLPGFWAVFGFFGAVILTVILKKIVAPMLAKPEDYYDHD